MKFLKFIIFISLLQCGLLTAQDEPYIFNYPKADKIEPVLKCKTYLKDNNVEFNYSLLSRKSSEQNIWTLRITYSSQMIIELNAPEGWLVRKPKNKDFISWGSSNENNFIIPGNELDNFIIVTNGLPAISRYYIQGYVPTPILEREPDEIVGGSFYKNSKQGKTLGPKDPPADFVATTFIDTLISYKHHTLELGWITNQGVDNSLDKKLENAKKQLEKGKTKTAINILNAFLNEVEAQKDKHLTSEAYALLKFNAEYLIKRLE